MSADAKPLAPSVLSRVIDLLIQVEVIALGVYFGLRLYYGGAA